MLEEEEFWIEGLRKDVFVWVDVNCVECHWRISDIIVNMIGKLLG